MVAIPYIIFRICSKEKDTSALHSTKRKNLVALGLLNIYITIYIFILDVIAANIVRTSSHEYARELSPRNISFNLGVTYLTLTCDLIAVVVLIIMLILIFNKKIKSVEGIFLSLLITPSICITSHLGYIMLAWITQPSRSTTTLILYYFLLSYMYLMFRKTYKLGQKCELIKQIKKKFSELKCSLEQRCDSDVYIKYKPRKKPRDLEMKDIPQSNSAKNVTSTPPTESSSGIDLCLFFFIGVLGIYFLGLAVVFVMMIYLIPLASEDLFSYVFNVIQFMIVVVSTQYAYKLIVGKELCFKKIIKHIINGIKHKVVPSDESISKGVGKLVAEKLLIPQLEYKKEESTSQLTTSSPHKVN